jgi:hypothetical protein
MNKPFAIIVSILAAVGSFALFGAGLLGAAYGLSGLVWLLSKVISENVLVGLAIAGVSTGWCILIYLMSREYYNYLRRNNGKI